MKTKRIYLCEDSIEGIFTAIYDAWSSRYGHDYNRIELQSVADNDYNLELFSEYITVKTDVEKANKVAKSIHEKISSEAYDMICHAVLSDDSNKGDLIYRFLIVGFSYGAKVVDNLSNDAVMQIFNLNRNVGNEAHHFTGFLRFLEIQDHILVAKIKPKNDIIRIIAPHFSDRFGQENFIIYDEKRKTAIIHRRNYPWVYTNATDFNLDELNEISEQEEHFQNLWKTFFDTIAIEERKNFHLQRNNLPLRFRSNMLEFYEKNS